MKTSTLLLLLAVLCASATITGGEPDGPVVVLKNGTVLYGKGTNLGEKVSVELTDGGEVKLPKSQVEIIADSMDDAYLQRRDKLMPENVLSQLSLAHWCVDQGLKDEARSHLRAAKKIDSSHPGIIRLERKLRDEQRAAQEELPEKVIEPPPTEAVKDLLKERIEASRRVSRGETGDISLASKTRFNKEVQPILLGSCATSKCHGPNSTSEFRIIRSSAQSENHAVLIKRNLQTVLARLNIDAPEESPLLENAIQAHSPTMRTAPIAATSKEFSVLIEWTIAATDDLKRPKMAYGGIPSEATAPGRAPSTIPSTRAGNKSTDPEIDAELSPEPRSRKGEPRVAEKTTKPGARKSSNKKPSSREEEGPADPSEFNQRYFPNEPK